MEKFDYYDHTPKGVIQRRTEELREKGLDVETIVFVQQGRTLDEKLGQRDQFEEWIKEKEAAGWKREGVPLSTGNATEVQLMSREKQE